MNTDTHTIRLHRVLKAKPERVYRAFLDADAKARQYGDIHLVRQQNRCALVHT